MPAKLVPTFAGIECRVISATDLHGRILGFLDRSRCYFFQVAPQLYSRGWLDPALDTLFLRISGSPGNRTLELWICRQELWTLDHRGGSPEFNLLLISSWIRFWFSFPWKRQKSFTLLHGIRTHKRKNKRDFIISLPIQKIRANGIPSLSRICLILQISILFRTHINKPLQ
jgi:hypothetical protein